MMRNGFIILVLMIAFVTGCGCVGNAMVDDTPDIEQWAKELTLKHAEFAIGHKLYPDLDDHYLVVEPAGGIGENIREFRVCGKVYRMHDGKGYNIHSSFRHWLRSGDVEWRFMYIGNTQAKIPEITATFDPVTGKKVR